MRKHGLTLHNCTLRGFKGNCWKTVEHEVHLHSRHNSLAGTGAGEGV